jgi:hypothetical protein
MRRIIVALALTLLLSLAPMPQADAATEYYGLCDVATSTDCNWLTGGNPYAGNTGDPLGVFATKYNLNFMWLSPLWVLPAYSFPCNSTGSTGGLGSCAVSQATLDDLLASTTFTIAATGCTPSAHAGGPFGGTITLASGPCTSIVITMNGATGFIASTGYHCSVGDRTAMAAGSWIPAWSESATTTTTATIPVPAAAGATDVISFTCDWY